MKKFTSFLILLALLVLLIWAFNTCSTQYDSDNVEVADPLTKPVPLRELIANIDNYVHRPVLISGTVEDSYYLSIIGGSYLLADTTATLRILTHSETPAKGARMLVIIEPKLLWRINANPQVIAAEVKVILIENEVTTDLEDETIRF